MTLYSSSSVTAWRARERVSREAGREAHITRYSDAQAVGKVLEVHSAYGEAPAADRRTSASSSSGAIPAAAHIYDYSSVALLRSTPIRASIAFSPTTHNESNSSSLLSTHLSAEASKCGWQVAAFWLAIDTDRFRGLWHTLRFFPRTPLLPISMRLQLPELGDHALPPCVPCGEHGFTSSLEKRAVGVVLPPDQDPCGL